MTNEKDSAVHLNPITNWVLSRMALEESDTERPESKENVFGDCSRYDCRATHSCKGHCSH